MASSFFLDSDVILDVLLERENFYINAKKIMALGAKKQIIIFCSPIIITNVFYIVRKAKGGATAFSIIKNLLENCKILSVGEFEIISAINSEFNDFEDAIQYYTALRNPKIKGIITRNIADYKKAALPIYTPESFLDLFR